MRIETRAKHRRPSLHPARNPAGGNRAGRVALGTTYGPTPNHIVAFNRANDQLQELKVKIKDVSENVLPQLERDLKSAGAPWIEGQGLIDN